MRIRICILATVSLFCLAAAFQSEQELADFLQNVYEGNASNICYRLNVAEWNFNTDVNNKDKEQALLNETIESGAVRKYYWQEYFKNLTSEDYQTEAIKRQVDLLNVLGVSALDTDKLSQFSSITTNMTNIYSAAKICPYQKQDCDLATEGLSLEPGIEQIMSTSTDYDELVYAWKAWRDATGANIKQQFNTYVELSNEAATLNGFNNQAEYWMNDYETPTFEDDLFNLWEQVKPLYTQLHKFVSNKLKERYGDSIDISDGLIPAHVLGNMWAQSWGNLASLVKPYPNASSPDVTAALQAQNYTVLKMFETSNDFYLSLGLEDSSISYNVSAGAVIEKPEDRDILCHASAWDFCDGENYRIKMCTEVNYEDFITIHHEMGHIQYFLLYKNESVSFRDGANPGFHEAVGDTIALSVSTPKHLKEIGLLTDYVDSVEADINTLMNMALEKVAFLPFGFLIDKWRWDCFSGKVTPDQYNTHWWSYRESIQGLKPPVPRSDATDFDPGAKYHVAGNSQYINYFVAHILQFQMYRGLCLAAGQFDPNDETKPLYKCDYYKSLEAGNKLRAGLSLGRSRHWRDILEAMTGERDLDATALLDYFKPLHDYLIAQNQMDEGKLKQLLDTEYETTSSKVQNKGFKASWAVETDLGNKEKEAAELNTTLEIANVAKYYWKKYFQYLVPKYYKDESIKRQVHSLRILGDAALEKEKLTQLTNSSMQMTSIYGQAKVCPYKNQNCNITKEGWSLEPDIEDRFSDSKDTTELLYLWTSWRNATGAKMRDLYKRYVKLSNLSAKANNFTDRGAMWRDSFESPTFVQDIEKLWKEVSPLYETLHTFASYRLKDKYKEKIDVSDGLIPAHVLGNMWAQTWTTISDILKPYPDGSKLNVTKSLVDQKYTPLKMFETANEFYQSLGLDSSAISYDTTAGAIIEKPTDKEIVCHASAWDFFDRKDYRIKMCTKVTFDDFVVIHHEMGHIQYYMMYKNQSVTFRDGANPGFHEAIGDTIALSVSSTKHLKRIGLLKEDSRNDESDINALMDMALEKVAFLPFGYLIDKWRWDVFSGAVTPDKWNSHWWYYRESIQKVKAPVTRSDTHDFDPGAKFHVANGDQYISYFIANILQFQLYRGLCKAAGEYVPHNSNKPLHKCDFYKSLEVGKKLRNGLSLGSSRHWRDVLEAITGERDYDASAILEYFSPLKNVLDDIIKKEKSSRFLPIAVGCIFGLVLVVGLVLILYRRYKTRRS